MRYLLLAVMLVSLVGCETKLVPAPVITNAQSAPLAVAPSKPAKKTYTREEFKKLVVGMNQDEVMGLLGNPESTTEISGQPVWRYEQITVDPITNKADSATRFIFRNGVVDEVYF
ncbi:MAG: hypothetical protein QM703_13650 [Gemmatales bacterium]